MTELAAEDRDVDDPRSAAPRSPSLRKNVVWSMTGNLVLAATQWLVLIALARLGTPADIGMWTLATAIVTPVFMLSDLAMNDGHTVDDLAEFTRADYFALRMVGAIAGSVICVVAALVWFGDQSALLAATLAFVVVRFINAQMMLNGGVLQRERRVDLLARSLLARGLLGLALFTLVFWLTNSLWAALVGQALAWGLVLVLMDRRYLAVVGVTERFRSVLRTDAPTTLFRLFLWLLPLALSAVLVSATVSAPRLVLASYVDLATLGMFGVIAFFDTGFSVAINAIGIASASYLRAAMREGSRGAFLALSIGLVALTASVALVLYAIAWLFGAEILALVYGQDYVNHELLMLIVFAVAVRSALAPLQVALTAGHVFWRRSFVNAVGFVVTLVAALLLVPDSGIYGAALSLVIGAVTRAMLLVTFFIHLAATMTLPPHDAAYEAGET